MYFRYGSHTHPANEVNIDRFQIQSRMSGRNRRRSMIYTMHISGELLYDTQTALTAAIAQLRDAYDRNFQDAGFYQDDGTLTPHHLPNSSDCISGVQVVGRSWPIGDAAEYATKRTFSVVLQAEYDRPDSEVLEWSERFLYVGNGGPCIEVVPQYEGPPVVQRLHEKTAQILIQSGRSKGLNGYLLPPGAIFPGFEHQNERREEPGTPNMSGMRHQEYPFEWTYRMTLPFPRDTFPIPR
jgi:hypothetical protein